MFCFHAEDAGTTSIPVDMMDKQTIAITTLEIINNKMGRRRLISNGDDDLIVAGGEYS